MCVEAEVCNEVLDALRHGHLELVISLENQQEMSGLEDKECP